MCALWRVGVSFMEAQHAHIVSINHVFSIAGRVRTIFLLSFIYGDECAQFL